MAGRRRDPGKTLAKRRKRQAAAEVGAKGAQLARDVRVIAVQNLIAEGVPEVEIVRWLTTEITRDDVIAGEVKGHRLVEKPWKVSEPTARDYVRSALRIAATYNARDVRTKAHRVKDELRAEKVYRMALAAGDLRTALSANDQLCRIHQTYEPEIILEQPEDDDDLDLTEAVAVIEDGAAHLELARRRGTITPAQRATAIDASAEENAGDDGSDEPLVVEEPPAEAQPPAPGQGN